MDSHLIDKYNVPGPRYTSYPTVPYWDASSFSLQKCQEALLRSFHESNDSDGISLYIHLPFCESLCTFCACHKRITKRHHVERPYINALRSEWDLYLKLFDTPPRLRDLHFGGGTPTFFSVDHLKLLTDHLFSHSIIPDDFTFSFEAHPNHTSYEQLYMLYQQGAKRISFGIQDYDPTVQKSINRIQSFETVTKVHNNAKELGYTSISHDLLFGLPFQTIDTVQNSIEKTLTLKPERIAYYSYAHVPWIKGVGQRGFDENDLPKPEEKRRLYELGKHMLLEAGYIEIGMDHFALPSDSLAIAFQNGFLHRNFMGYSSFHTQVMVGLGVSSIGDSWYAFSQNEKDIDAYSKSISEGVLPLVKGHLLSDEDLIIRRHILNLMCQFETDLSQGLNEEQQAAILERLDEMRHDALITLDGTTLRITERGQMFVRNVCLAFDLRLIANRPDTRIFSMTI